MFWLVILIANAPLWYFLGARAERGKIEKQRDKREEERYARSVRTGTVKLSTVKIRR